MARPYFPANVITDPDSLTEGVSNEVYVDYPNLKIQLNVVSNLTEDGVTLKCLYSFLKEEWRANATFIKFPFPMLPITDEQFEVYNGWDFDKVATSGTESQITPQLIRTGGWARKDTANTTVDTDRWFCAISLGSLGSTDQIYYQQVDTLASDNTANVKLTSAMNQAIQFYSDPNGDGSTADGYNYSQYFKLFCREWAKIYATSNLSDIGVTNLTYQAYRFPLTNAADAKITGLGVSEANAGGAAWPYNEMDITWYANAQLRENFNTYDVGVSTSNAYFKVVIDADNASNIAANPTAEQIYAFVQAQLRKSANINVGTGAGDTDANVKIGKVVPAKLQFIGDDLYTLGQTTNEEGVYIDNFNAVDTNRLHFSGYDANVLGANVNTNIQFPFTAVLTLSMNDNLVADGNAIYRVFFTNDDAGTNAGADFGTDAAILVNDKDGNPMANAISGSSTITLNYDYDNNAQRGGGSAGTNAPITVVAIGLTTAQYIKATGTITRSVTNTVSLGAPLERNYDNP